MTVVVPGDQVEEAVAILARNGVEAYRIGEIVSNPEKKIDLVY